MHILLPTMMFLILMLKGSQKFEKKISVDPYLIRRIVINPDCLWTQASQSSLLALSDSGVLEGSIRITTFVPLATFGLVPKMKKKKSLIRRRKLNSHVPNWKVFLNLNFLFGNRLLYFKSFFCPFLLVKKNPIHCKKSYLLESKTYYVYK